MSIATFLICSLAVCLLAVNLQCLAYSFGSRRGFVLVTCLPFLLNFATGLSMIRSFRLCDPPTPGCEMGGIAVTYAVAIVAGATALLILSAIAIELAGRPNR